ncbi:MAG: ABC transporter ATP-binding protein [Candidatus Limnocylindrales bacterium]
MSAPASVPAPPARAPAPDGGVIVVRDLRKRFGDVHAVDGIEFDVQAGEIFGLLGPNGAGKTTTIEMLEGLQRPDGGTLRVLGLDPVREATRLKARIGVQLQTAALYPQLTVVEVLRLFGSFFPPGRAVPPERLIDALELGEKRDARSKTLSGGQRQRLSVALALVNDPELVFLDEPTTGLDPAARHSLWELILGLKAQGKSVLMTTHYMEEAELLCDRLAIMDHGKVLDLGTVGELVGRRFHERAVRFDTIAALEGPRLAAFPGVARVAQEDGETVLYTRDVPGTIGALLAATETLGADPANLMVRRATLEDVFLEWTGRALRD